MIYNTNTAALPEIFAMSDEFRDYLHDETKTVGTAESISFPESEAEIAAVLRSFSAQGIHVTVQGNRTGLTAASVPAGGHVLSLVHMDAVNGMRIGEDGTVYLRVQPGISLGVLREKIASRNFDTKAWDEPSKAAYAAFQKMPARYFPPDPTETSASVGGMAACNSSGAKTYHYGATRAFVSGARLVLSDGDVLSLHRGECFASGRTYRMVTEGGRVLEGSLPSYEMPRCKNASGYYAADNMDMLDLLIGSDGTLGVFSELELRLISMPKCIWGVDCFFRTLEQALSFNEAVRPRCPLVTAIEFFDGNALSILRAWDDGGCPVPEGFACMVYCEIHSDDPDAALAELKTLGVIMEEVGGDSGDTWCARSSKDRERLLELRHRVPESVNALIAERKRKIPAIAKVGSDMAVPDAAFRTVMDMYARDLAKNGFQYAMWGHLGNNHLHVNVLPQTADDMKRGKAMFAEWAQQVTDLGGTVSAEHGTGKIKANMLKILYGEKGLREMAAVRRVFDPKCTLGAGNLFPAEYVLDNPAAE